ncbi:DUF2510 domain-containing protein [Gordonia sp. OPL2]|uniref:DUF2510 domain-containing protein n=1 Tax=Gordonia sp. OPL2 TaxID=2486274 RepID=UPI00165632A9|nr:DUF2510 domain-containing protein [Gordonia sp. OPL2]ROZ89035.1 DUF2510 domain-containing protein [Gordonia sp. OPL2]
MTQPHPPGWYPDPHRRELQRYWDGEQWTDRTAPRGTSPKEPDFSPADADAKKRGTRRALIIAGVIAVVVLVVIAVGAVVNQRDQQKADRAEASKSSESVQFSIERESRARDAASSSAARAAEAAQARAAYESRRRATMLDKSSYTAVSAREWAQIAKDPTSARNKRIVVYGRVTQFDAGTGSDVMRVSVGGEPGDWYDYDTNTMVFSGDPGVLDDVVKDDLVTMWVQVEGEFSYDTQIGGSTTAPKLTAFIVEVTGSSG